MKDDIFNSALTFGVFLIIVGLVGRFFSWGQANVIFIMGVLFELFAVAIYLYRKFKK